MKTVIAGLPVDFTPNIETQRKRITHVTYEDVFDNDDQTYEHATHYLYDIHGNVKTLLQDNRKLATTFSSDADIVAQQIAKVLEISPTTVIKQIKKDASELKAPALPYNGVYEVDEMKSYCGNKKNDIWIAYGIERKTGKATMISAGKRTSGTLRKVINSILNTRPKKIYTDGLIHYKKLIPKTIHVSSSTFLNRIERKNLSVRNSIKRFNRFTLGYSRSILMKEACLKLFLWKEIKYSQ